MIQNCFDKVFCQGSRKTPPHIYELVGEEVEKILMLHAWTLN